VRLDPAGRWPNFYHGLCAYCLGRHEDAVAAFSVCIGAAPDSPDAYYHRALAHAALCQPTNCCDLRAALDGVSSRCAAPAAPILQVRIPHSIRIASWRNVSRSFSSRSAVSTFRRAFSRARR